EADDAKVRKKKADNAKEDKKKNIRHKNYMEKKQTTLRRENARVRQTHISLQTTKTKSKRDRRSICC
ncbi:hypothetical protein IscW_ISCW001680, partial [Ixodes scapularis]